MIPFPLPIPTPLPIPNPLPVPIPNPFSDPVPNPIPIMNRDDAKKRFEDQMTEYNNRIRTANNLRFEEAMSFVMTPDAWNFILSSSNRPNNVYRTNNGKYEISTIDVDDDLVKHWKAKAENAGYYCSQTPNNASLGSRNLLRISIYDKDEKDNLSAVQTERILTDLSSLSSIDKYNVITNLSLMLSKDLQLPNEEVIIAKNKRQIKIMMKKWMKILSKSK